MLLLSRTSTICILFSREQEKKRKEKFHGNENKLCGKSDRQQQKEISEIFPRPEKKFLRGYVTGKRSVQ